jgi:mannan endo-1,4-beta-mannosidase
VRSICPESGVLWGVYLTPSASLDDFERGVRKRTSLAHVAYPWATGATWLGFQQEVLTSHVSAGRVVLMDWGSWDLQRGFPLQAIVRGTYDAFLNQFAEDVASWGQPLLLRFDGEMNGWWQPWADRDRWGHADGQRQPGDFVRAWRKVHDVFKIAGASNVEWVWCANCLAPAASGLSTGVDALTSYFPGDDVVDWTGLDVYNWGGARQEPWLSLRQLLLGDGAETWRADSYNAIAELAPDKPMALCELACDTRGGDKAAWITDALAVIPSEFPRIRAVSWFDWSQDGAEWSLGLPTDGSAAAAFRRGIAAAAYR